MEGSGSAPGCRIHAQDLGMRPKGMRVHRRRMEQSRKGGPAWAGASAAGIEKELVARYGESQRVRVRRGLKQVSERWRDADGGPSDFEAFVRANFAGEPAAADTVFARFEHLLEQAYGHLQEIHREFRSHVDLDAGPIAPYDEIFAGCSPFAHLHDDLFDNKLAFVVLLNFPLTTLAERSAEGMRWTRRQWAETRLAETFSSRVPAGVHLAISRAAAAAERYISEYNIWMHHLVDVQGRRLFPPGMRLLSHWDLRDEIKAGYADDRGGLDKQRMIQKVMERIVDQTIPAAVINNPQLDWNPSTNAVRAAAAADSAFSPGPCGAADLPEPDTRYRHLLETFHAATLADPCCPDAPSLMARRFDRDRQIPEPRVRAMFEEVLTSDVVPRIASLIRRRLGRPLEPFDIWYSGFRPRAPRSEEDLDAIVRSRYPDAEAFARDIPELLGKLGFSGASAGFIAGRIVVEPARGSGHAMGAAMRTGKSRLRTRIGRDGMDYKGFNVAMHELGHNVEETLSLHGADFYCLNGVPNTSCTEALAFVFQNRDLEMLGLERPERQSEALGALHDFWAAFEICGVALVDMGVWRWMYAHPDAGPNRARAAVLEISKEVWNCYYAPVFQQENAVLLGVYSHMIDGFLYLPDYPLGHMIAGQLEEHMRKAGAIGPEVERIARLGRIGPDLWMTRATGAPVGPGPLIASAERALRIGQSETGSRPAPRQPGA